MNNDPAFPCKQTYSSVNDLPDMHESLTKRELFAAMAMQGLLARTNPDAIGLVWIPQVCMDAVKYADLLLAELEKK